MTREIMNTSSLVNGRESVGLVPSAQKAPNQQIRLGRLFPSLEGIVFSATLLTVILLGQAGILDNGDTALHLRLGNDMLLHGGLIQTNTLTKGDYGQPLIAWEWLADLLFAGLWRFWGLNGLLALVGFIAALTAKLLFRAVRRRSTPLLLALPLTLAAMALASIDWLALPQLGSLLLTLWWSESLWSYWQSSNPRKLWPLPFVLALWVNLDKSFIVGLLVLVTATVLVWFFPTAASTRDVNTRRWELTRVLLACLLAVFLTPWPFATVEHSLSFFSSDALLNYTRDTSATPLPPFYTCLFLSLLLLLGTCGVLRGWLVGGRAIRPADPGIQHERHTLAQLAIREPGALGWALVGLFTSLVFFSLHALPLWGVVITPILGRELTSWSAEWAAADMNERLTRLCRRLFRRSWKLEALDGHMRAGWWGALVAIMVFVLLLNRGTLPGAARPLLNAQFSSSTFPVEAVQSIQHGIIPSKTLPDGTGFTIIAWADYIEWALPDHLIMVDSRTNFFDDSVLRDYQTLLNGEPGWNEVINAYGIRWLLIPPTIPLAQAITLAQGWLCQDADMHHMALFCIPAPTLPVT